MKISFRWQSALEPVPVVGELRRRSSFLERLDLLFHGRWLKLARILDQWVVTLGSRQDVFLVLKRLFGEKKHGGVDRTCVSVFVPLKRQVGKRDTFRAWQLA